MAALRTGIIVCSRVASTRVPQKAILDINGKRLICHLLDRLCEGPFPVVLAVPETDVGSYVEVLGGSPKVQVYAGEAEDPLARTCRAAEKYGFDTVVRVVHDKTFVEPRQIAEFVEILRASQAGYVYSSDFVPGCGFEVFTYEVLKDAALGFKNVEHISFAIRQRCQANAYKIIDVPLPRPKEPVRLMVDYPADVAVLKKVFERLGNDCTQEQAVTYLRQNHGLRNLNALPAVTVYTCAKDASPWITECMDSVKHQTIFTDIEYLLIDDGSRDDTFIKMQRFADRQFNTFSFGNGINIGLASSSNIAIAKARGEYVIRLDADDWFARDTVLEEMLAVIRATKADALYPDHYLGSSTVIEKGSLNHHMGGTMLSKRALEYVRFTDGLRHFDSLDFYKRAKNVIRIGYMDRPCFYYRQHEKSLSKSEPEERAKVLQEIEGHPV